MEGVWNGKKYTLDWAPHLSYGPDDLGIWQIAQSEMEGTKFPFVPVRTDGMLELRQHPAVTLGYGGMAARSISSKMRLLSGHIDSVEPVEINGSMVEQIEVLDLAVGKGASGSPIFDLRAFRVVGYVSGEFGTDKNRISRLGRGRTLTRLSKIFPEAVPLWKALGDEFDTRKREFFANIPFPSKYLTLSDLQFAAEQVSRSELSRLEKVGIYRPDVFVPRQVDSVLNEFLHDEQKATLLFTGQSGSGKTNQLAAFYNDHASSFDLSLFLTFRKLHGESLGDAICHSLWVEGSLLSIRQLLASEGYKSTLLVLDGFEDSKHATEEGLADLLKACTTLSRETSHRVKIVISARREWINEVAPDLLSYTDEPTNAFFDVSSVFFETVEPRDAIGTTKYRPVLELPLLSPIDESDRQEQEKIYEGYRRVLPAYQSIAAYPDLPFSVRQVLDRPLLIKMFIAHYHDRRISETFVRSRFVREIVESQTERMPLDKQTKREANKLLQRLAFELFRSGHAGISDHALTSRANREWCDPDVLDSLLKHTLYLIRTDLRGPGTSSSEISFSSDWLADYFLGLYILDEASNIGGIEERREFIQELFPLLKKGADGSSLSTALSYLCEFCTSEQHDTFIALWSALSAVEPDAALSYTVRSVCEYMRANYGFEPSDKVPPPPGDVFLAKLRNTTAIGNRGWGRIVAFAEALGDQGTPDAIALLTTHPVNFTALDHDLQARWESVLALKQFKKHDIAQALEAIRSLDFLSLPLHVQSMASFVEGRCLQFRKEYEEAAKAFQRGVDVDDEYGSMCRHQLGFILFLRDSDYAAAAEVLRKNSDNHSSRLLLIQCLVETCHYDEAARLLEVENSWRRERRRTLSYGKVKRVEAQMLTRLFRTSEALDAVNEAIECSRGSVHFLSYANILEIKGYILGVLAGDVPAAMNLVDESIELAIKGKHDPTRSWSLQTRLMIEVLAGEQADVEQRLSEMSGVHSNPNLERRGRLILLLDQHQRKALPVDRLTEAFAALQRDYDAAGQTWYSAWIAFLLLKLEGRTEFTAEEVRSRFGNFIDIDGLKGSYAFRRLFGPPSIEQTPE